jgi:hypothetical protein
MSIEHDALKRFVEATSQFESRFGRAIIGPARPFAETGEAYTEYANGRADHPWDEVFETPYLAIDATFSRLSALFPTNPKATLHWRVKPEIDFSEARKGYVTYCRFLVSENQR